MNLTNIPRLNGLNQPSCRANVVFVHGLEGDPIKTWQYRDQTDKSWLNWLAEDFPELGVWTLGYAADATKWKQESMPLADRADAVLELLYSKNLGYRPLLFITHSMGGIVVKYLLTHAENLKVPRWQAIAAQTRGIAFIATPHSGAKLANFIQFVSFILRTNEQVAELGLHETRLLYLHRLFLGYQSEHKVICRSYYETHETRGFYGLKMPKGLVVVDATSADPFIPNEVAIPIDADHLSICKPESREAELYSSISGFIRECLQKIEDSPEKKNDPFPFWHVPQIQKQCFTDRVDILNQLVSILNSSKDAPCTLTLTGLPGIGKTQLALEYSYRHKREYDGVWWFHAESPATLAIDFSSLAYKLQQSREELDQCLVIDSVRLWLENQRKPWLLVFDNAHDSASLAGYLPQAGLHHVLITSYNPFWQDIARTLPVRGFSRPDSISFLKKRTGSNDEGAAKDLCDELDDLPLALEQAAALMEKTGISIPRYLGLFKQQRRELMAQQAIDCSAVAAIWEISFKELEQKCPEALALLNLYSFLAQHNIPRSLLPQPSENLPLHLQKIVSNPVVYAGVIGVLRGYSIIELELSGESFCTNRLLQAVTRDRLGANESPLWSKIVVETISAAFPYDKDKLTTWSTSGVLLPHALAAIYHAEKRWPKGLISLSHLHTQVGIYLMDRAQLTEAKKHFESAIVIIERLHGTDYPDIARNASALGQILHHRGNLHKALNYAERALMIDEKTHGPDHRDVARDANIIATILKDKCALERAKSFAERALKIDEEVYGKDHPSVARDADVIAAILKDKGDLDGALSHASRALAIDEKTYGKDHPAVATIGINIAGILKDKHDLDSALSYAKRTLEIDEEVYGKDHPSVARDADVIAAILKDKGDLDGALSHASRALAIDEKTYGKDHPAVATIGINIAGILQAKEDLDGALRHAMRALTIDEKAYEFDSPAMARDHDAIAAILRGKGDLDGALRHASRALAINEKTYGKDHPAVGTIGISIAGILQTKEDLEGARHNAERALRMDEKVYGKDHSCVARDTRVLAGILKDKNDLDGALSYAMRTLEINEKIHGKDHPAVARDARVLAWILKEKPEDLDKALDHATRALAIDEKAYELDSPAVARDHDTIAAILRSKGDLDGALSHAKRTLEIDEKVHGKDHPSVARDANVLAWILKDKNDLDRALSHAMRALEIDEKVYGKDHSCVARDAHVLTWILKDKNDLDGALRYVIRALNIDEKVYGFEDVKIARDVETIALMLKDKNDLDEALRYAMRALNIDEKVYGFEDAKVVRDVETIALILIGKDDLDGALRYAKRALSIDEKVYGKDHLCVTRAAEIIAGILKRKEYRNNLKRPEEPPFM